MYVYVYIYIYVHATGLYPCQFLHPATGLDPSTAQPAFCVCVFDLRATHVAKTGRVPFKGPNANLEIQSMTKQSLSNFPRFKYHVQIGEIWESRINQSAGCSI